MRFGNKFQEHLNSSQISLFGEETDNSYQDLTIPHCDPWSNLIRLKKEKK